MPRDENISADTSGRSGDVGGSTSGGKAGDDPLDAFRDMESGAETPVSGNESARGAQDGTPEDLEPGKRKAVGQDEDAGAGSGVPGSTASD